MGWHSGSMIAALALGAVVAVAAAQEPGQWQAVKLSIPPGDNGFSNVVRGAGLFVAVGYSPEGGFFAVSADGLSWGIQDSGDLGFSPRDVAWGNGVLVSVGPGGEVFVSPYGLTWQHASLSVTHDTATPLPPDFVWVRWDGAEFITASLHVGIGLSYGSVLTSLDGSAWTEYPRPRFTPAEIAWSGLRYVAAGEGYAASSPALAYSPNLYAWSAADIPVQRTSGVGLVSVAWGAGRFVAVGDLGGAVLLSTDGETWTVHPLPSSSLLWRVVFDGGRFVAVGDGLTILTSANGLSWTRGSVLEETVPPEARDARLRGVAWDGKHWVAVGEHGTVLLSTAPVSPRLPRRHLVRQGP